MSHLSKFYVVPLFWVWIGILVLSLSCASSPRAKRVEAVKGMQEEMEVLKKERADANVKLDDMKTEIQILSGKIEENQHFLKKTHKWVEKNDERVNQLIADYDQKILSLETALEQEQKKDQETQEKLSALEIKMDELLRKPKKSASLGPDARYDYLNGIKRFKEKDYDAAIILFSNYNKSFPAGRAIQDARYYLAEAHFEKKDYQNAILKYEEYKEKFPKGKRVAEAIYKQAMSFRTLGKKNDAKVFLQDLIVNHPQSEFAIKAKVDLKSLK